MTIVELRMSFVGSEVQGSEVQGLNGEPLNACFNYYTVV